MKFGQDKKNFNFFVVYQAYLCTPTFTGISVGPSFEKKIVKHFLPEFFLAQVLPRVLFHNSKLVSGSQFRNK